MECAHFPKRCLARPPFTNAVHHHNDLRFVIPLVNAGCEINAKVANGDTPLSRAATAGNDIVGAYLIERGANINSTDKLGNTPLMNAVRCGSTAVVKLLLERGADDITVNSKGHTILHDAVDFRSVNIETLKFLKNASMRIDTQARDSAGLAALDLMQQRSDISDEVRVAFEALLEGINTSEPNAHHLTRDSPPPRDLHFPSRARISPILITDKVASNSNLIKI